MLFLDLWIEFAFRVIIRLFRDFTSRSWPINRAEATSVSYRPGVVGCALAEVTYKYKVQGETYTGFSAKPFLWGGSAKTYIEQHFVGSVFPLRVNPKRPDSSIMRDLDD